MAKEAGKRSPLKDPAMRNPGQSLAEERQRVWDDYCETPAIFFIAFGFLAYMKWVEEWLEFAPSPWLWTALAAVCLAFLVYRFIRSRPVIRRLKLGEQGERAVGQYLERLREQQYHVFHDVIGDGFNVDHVLIGPAGVFTIETKTWSKPGKGEAKIFFDGESLTLPGQAANRRPIIQARAQAGWLRALLAESTGHKIKVHPVVVFPGWYIESTNSGNNATWVLNPKALPAFLGNAPKRLSSGEIKLMSFHLSRWIRAEEAQILRR